MTNGRTVQTVDERAVFLIRLSTGFAGRRALNA
jgi:hypothetical protein